MRYSARPSLENTKRCTGKCPACGFLGIRDPHWLEEAYSDSIAITDTGLISRNLSLARRIASFLYIFLGERGSGRYLDYAGGYRLLTRLMRDRGFGFYWLDRYSPNLLARGFEYTSLGPCRAVTAFEALEHVADPVGFIHEALAAGGTDILVFSTELYYDPPPRMTGSTSPARPDRPVSSGARPSNAWRSGPACNSIRKAGSTCSRATASRIRC